MPNKWYENDFSSKRKVIFGGYSDDLVGFELSDKRKAMMNDYVNYHITNEDVKREMGSKDNESAFWADFREHYVQMEDRENGEPAFDFADVAHVPGVYYDLDAREVKPVELRTPPSKPTPKPQPQRPVRKPEVSSSGRRGSEPSRESSTVVRALRGIGRLFGFGGNK